MANVFNGERWVLDTASGSMVISQSVYVKTIEWVAAGLTKDVSTVDIQDALGVTREKFIANDTTVNDHRLVEEWWYGGFKVPTLDGGVLIVHHC